MIPRKPNTQEEIMKTVILTPSSSVKSSATVDSNFSETRDSFYFPGCRKDANCKCEICIASINATLDLMPQSHRSTLTRVSRPAVPRSPVSFNPSSAGQSTPPPRSKSQIRPLTVSPPLNSSARTCFQEKMKKRKRDLGLWVFMGKILLGLIFVFGIEYGVSWLVSGVFKAKLSPDIVKNLGEKSCEIEGLKGRFLFLKNEVEMFVGERVANCSSIDSVWKIDQDGLLLNSRCVLYKSMTEEVSIWGWPLQSAGLLTAESSQRSFSVISGRVTEWSNGEASYLVWKANSSWASGKWSSSAVQFDPNTWILEYRRSFFMDNARMVSATIEFLKFRLRRELGKMKQEFWLLYAFASQYSYFREGSSRVPT